MAETPQQQPPSSGEPLDPAAIEALLQQTAVPPAEAFPGAAAASPDPTVPDVTAASAMPADHAANASSAAGPLPPELLAALGAAPPTEEPAALDAASIDELLRQARFDDPTEAIGGLPAPHSAPTGAGVDGHAAAPPAPHVPLPSTDAFSLPDFQQVMQDAQVSSIDLLRDVELNVKIELGRSRMLVEDVLRLNEGSVVELDKLAGDPVDVFVNDRLVARGEVLVLNDNFCVRVNEIVAGAKEEGL